MTIPASAQLAAYSVGVRLLTDPRDGAVIAQCRACDRFSMRPVDVGSYRPVPCGRCIQGARYAG